MDPVTHTLTGALIGQTGLKRRTGLAMPALMIGANLPDVDVACFLWLDGVEHLAFRRGITHGPVAWVLLPLLLAGALWWFDRWQARRGKRPEARLPMRFGWLYGLSFIACLTHPALDWLNVYGIRLLEPFSSRWFYGDVLFIVDVWLWAILGVGLWLSLRREKRGGDWRRPARIALTLTLVYVGINAAITAHAEDGGRLIARMEFGPEQIRIADRIGGGGSSTAGVIGSPLPLAFWKRETLVGENGRWVVEQCFTFDDCVAQPVVEATCALPDPSERPFGNPQLGAFLFWSRAPFAERALDGSVLIRDARYYDPRARDRFTVALPDVRCEPLP